MFFIIAGAILLAIFGVYLVKPSSNNKTEEKKRDTTSIQAKTKMPSYQVALLEAAKDNVNKKRHSMVTYSFTDRYFLENYWKEKAAVAAVTSMFIALYAWKRVGSVSALGVFIVAFMGCYINLSWLWEWRRSVDLSLLQFQAKAETNQIKLLDSAKGQQSKKFVEALNKAKETCTTACTALAKQGKKAAKKLEAYKKHQQFLQDTIHAMETLIKNAEAEQIATQEKSNHHKASNLKKRQQKQHNK